MNLNKRSVRLYKSDEEFADRRGIVVSEWVRNIALVRARQVKTREDLVVKTFYPGEKKSTSREIGFDPETIKKLRPLLPSQYRVGSFSAVIRQWVHEEVLESKRLQEKRREENRQLG